ncbi:MAG: PH domain-containing protein [Actinobacteria bacterium]|nr:PH domain-containing protein [Actinomycetota bacterium]
MILREPTSQLDPRVRRLWALEWGLVAFLAAVPTTAVALPLALADKRLAAALVAAIGAIVTLVLVGVAVLQPRLLYRRFRYEITDLGLYVARGSLWRTWQVVPHARIQTVDTKRGPLERALGLVSVAVTTASASGGTDIPGLDPRVADALVEELARRAGIDEGT